MVSSITGVITTVLGNDLALPVCTRYFNEIPACMSSIHDSTFNFNQAGNTMYGQVVPALLISNSSTLIGATANFIVAAQLYNTTAFLPTSFRKLPRSDLVGTLIGNVFFPNQPLHAPRSETACQIQCYTAPLCSGYTFKPPEVSFDAYGFSRVVPQISVTGQTLTVLSGTCYLYSNITAIVPNSMLSSGLKS